MGVTQIHPKTHQNSNVAQFVLACLLVLLADHPHFCSGGPVDLTVSLAIGGVVSIAGKVVVSLSE